jgi:hypothetical protein
MVAEVKTTLQHACFGQVFVDKQPRRLIHEIYRSINRQHHIRLGEALKVIIDNVAVQIAAQHIAARSIGSEEIDHLRLQIMKIDRNITGAVQNHARTNAAEALHGGRGLERGNITLCHLALIGWHRVKFWNDVYHQDIKITLSGVIHDRLIRQLC